MCSASLLFHFSWEMCRFEVDDLLAIALSIYIDSYVLILLATSLEVQEKFVYFNTTYQIWHARCRSPDNWEDWSKASHNEQIWSRGQDRNISNFRSFQIVCSKALDLSSTARHLRLSVSLESCSWSQETCLRSSQQQPITTKSTWQNDFSWRQRSSNKAQENSRCNTVAPHSRASLDGRVFLTTMACSLAISRATWRKLGWHVTQRPWR